MAPTLLGQCLVGDLNLGWESVKLTSPFELLPPDFNICYCYNGHNNIDKDADMESFVAEGSNVNLYLLNRGSPSYFHTGSCTLDDVQHYSYPSIASHILQLEKYLISVDHSKLKIY